MKLSRSTKQNFVKTNKYILGNSIDSSLKIIYTRTEFGDKFSTDLKILL